MKIKLKHIAFLFAFFVGISTLSSCAIFKRDCGCPSVHGGKQ